MQQKHEEPGERHGQMESDTSNAEGEPPGWYERAVKPLARSWYQRYFEELILRQKPLPPSKDGRHITVRVERDKPLVDERRGHAYISNSVRSSRYTIWDFLPKQIIFQATRLHNFYFLCIGIPQVLGLASTGNFTTILPLAFFILLTVIKEGFDDYRRHRLDKRENADVATVLRPRDDGHHGKTAASLLSTFSSLLRPARWRSPGLLQEQLGVDRGEGPAWISTRWQDIQVGDIVRLTRDDSIPADIVLLSTDRENGVAYIETMALDGETNLKSKQALPALMSAYAMIDGHHRRTDAEFVLEDPNKDLYSFNGKAKMDGKVYPLTLNEVIFRGCRLRNTPHALGLVINTGEECKIRMNANHHPEAKKPRLERYANQIVLALIAYVAILSVGVSMGYLIWHRDVETKAFYLKDAFVDFAEIIVGFLIMFNNIIPLALYVSLEIVKIGQRIMVQNDMEMYDEVSNTPMTCNTNTILENLGQISYILSDKTGTMTDNIMRFRGMSIAGMIWMQDVDPVSENAEDPVRPDAERADRKSPEELKLDPEHTSHRQPAVVIYEREISTAVTIEVPSEPRPSAQVSVRQSFDQRRGIRARRTTQELLGIISSDPTSVIARKAHEFILAMAICHTAIPESVGDIVDFQASSPDELALVRAAVDLGYLLVNRSSQKIEILIKASSTRQSYEILDVIEFSSDRKRMSVVVRCPDRRIWLVCKGADSTVVPLLRQAELATRKSTEVRKSLDVERRLQRKSAYYEPRTSFGARPSLNIHERSSMDIRRSGRRTLGVPGESTEARHSLQHDIRRFETADDADIFTRCFHHLNEFATDGLRTLMFAHRYLDEEEYSTWKKLYVDATTSLVHRQHLIERAGELIEQQLDLLGASAIEDKLQKGVPETIDRLRRAGIRLFMLTGDRRETAINIAHAARICQPLSVISILDVKQGDVHAQMTNLLQDSDSHRVVVIDGHSLSVVQAEPHLKQLFFGVLIAEVDSVIVCRASPSQKADIVKGIKARLPGLTLTIGDGANDVAMIQAAHVGIGISGQEGLQAARVADFSIAQFRFLQRLLLVHGRYQYCRTAKFVLMTFWKEAMFYTPQLLYQKYDGYTGSSLYESWSLTALNTLFTSLCVIVPGIFEQDLRPDTLLAVPELYAYGQRNLGLNLPKCILWILLAVVDGLIIWFISWAAYGKFKVMGDNGTFALGDLCFTACILWTNWKLLVIEAHYKTLIVMGSLLVTVAGWFAWNAFMSGIYSNNLSPFDVKDGFLKGFGTEWSWWLTLLITLGVLGTMELVYFAARRRLLAAGVWPPWKRACAGRGQHAAGIELELWQKMERDPRMREKLRLVANGEDLDEVDVGYEDEDNGGRR